MQGGEFRTKRAELFPAALNYALAEALLSVKPATTGWLNAVSSAIGNYTNRNVMAISDLIAAESFADPAPDDPLTLVRSIQAMGEEFGDAGEDEYSTAAQTIVQEVSRIAAAVCGHHDAKAAGGSRLSTSALPR